MNKRNKFVIGYICGYAWHWFKPVRKAIIQTTKTSWQKAAEKDRNGSEKPITILTASSYEHDISNGSIVKVIVPDKESMESWMRMFDYTIKEFGYIAENDIRNSLRLPMSYDGETHGWASLDEVYSYYRDFDKSWVIVFPKPESLVGL